MILPAVVSALFASRLRESANRDVNFDPEKGDKDGDLARGEQLDNDRDGDDDFDEGPDDVPRDEEDEINEIIRNVDYPPRDNDDDDRRNNSPTVGNDDDPQLQRRRHRVGRGLSRSSSFFSASDYSPSFWARLKSAINPPSSPELLDSYIPHYRLTPILSGIVIPFSILLEIPGLTEDWYIRTGEANKTVETRPNTPILEAGLGISLACAVVANIFLVMRFLEYKVLITTILCITFLTLHDVINITTVTIFGVEHRFDDGFTYGQAYWMTLCSTVASLFTNITLIYDLFRIQDFAKSGSGLTRKQRSLVIIVIVLLCYIALGGLINSLLLHLSFINGLYFTLVSIETIGFGDIVPKTTGSKIWVCLYATAGIINVGLAVGMCRETVLEGLEVGYRKRVASVRRKRKEMRKKRLVEGRWREGVEQRLRRKGEVVWVRDDLDHENDGGGWKKMLWRALETVRTAIGIKEKKHHDYHHHHHHHHGMHLNLDALTPAELEASALGAGVPLDELLPADYMVMRQARKQRANRDSEDGKSSTSSDEDVGIEERIRRALRSGDVNKLTHARMGGMVAMLGRFALAVHAHGGQDGSGFAVHEDDVSEHHVGVELVPTMTSMTAGNENGSGTPPQSIESFRKGVEKEEWRAFVARFVVAWSLFVVFWLVGSAIFQQTEGWTFGIALYFCFVSFTTIGYGDYTPTTPAGRSVFVVWALLGVATMTILISVLSEAYSSRYRKALHTHAFENAVKRYRLRKPMITTEPFRPSISGGRSRGYSVASQSFSLAGATVVPIPRPSLPIRTTPAKVPTLSRTRTISISGVEGGGDVKSRSPSPSPPRTPSPSPSETVHDTQQQLEALPQEILRHAKAFHDDVRYFIGMRVMGDTAHEHLGGEGGQADVPESLKLLLNDITGAERIGERVKDEILKDDDARKTLFALSIENSLIKMIESAESALLAITQRNVIEAQRQRNVATQVLHEEEGEHDDSLACYGRDSDSHKDDHANQPTTSNIPPE